MSEVPRPALRGWQMLGKLAFSLDGLTLTARSCYDSFDVLWPDVGRIVVDANGVSLPVQADVDDVRLCP
jgi:hypothetical protein